MSIAMCYVFIIRSGIAFVVLPKEAKILSWFKICPGSNCIGYCSNSEVVGVVVAAAAVVVLTSN
jgi:hypothetical protein